MADRDDIDLAVEGAGVPPGRPEPAGRRAQTAAEQRASKQEEAADPEQTPEDITQIPDVVADKAELEQAPAKKAPAKKAPAKKAPAKKAPAKKAPAKKVAGKPVAVPPRAAVTPAVGAERVPAPATVPRQRAEIPPLARTLSAPGSSVPEPGFKKAYAVAGLALIGLLLVVLRRRHKK